MRYPDYKYEFEIILGIKYNDAIKEFIKKLESEGHTQKGISYAIYKQQDKLSMYKNDPRFLGILRNEINKYSWKKGDPRWNEYWKNKRNG